MYTFKGVALSGLVGGNVMATDGTDDFPAVLFEAHRGIVHEPAFAFTVDGNTIVIVQVDPLAQTQGIGQRAHFVRNTFLLATISNESAGIVPDDVVARRLELSSQQLHQQGKADGVGDALPLSHSRICIPRFFCPQPLVAGTTASLPEAVAPPIRVVCLAPSNVTTPLNDAGGKVQASLVAVAKRSVTAEIQAHVAREAELPYAVTLAQALPEASKMDWIIEKAIELGTAGIVPLAAQRCVVRRQRAGRKEARALARHYRFSFGTMRTQPPGAAGAIARLQ